MTWQQVIKADSVASLAKQVDEVDAVILCPGPSLARYEPLTLDEQVEQWRATAIAVNRAAEEYACDWWANLDLGVWRQVAPRQVRRGLLSSGAALKEMRRAVSEGQVDGEVVDIDALLAQSEVGRGWTPPARVIFTAPHAVLAAMALGARRVLMIGADMEGCEDWKGRAAEKRDEGRWTREKASLKVFALRLRQLGGELWRAV